MSAMTSKLIGELYRLSDRYDVPRLRDRIIDEFTERYFSNALKCESDEEFEQKWLTIGSIARIATESQVLGLMEKVKTFIDTNFEHILKKDKNELRELNDLTDGIILEIMANKCREFCEFEPKLLDLQRAKRIQCKAQATKAVNDRSRASQTSRVAGILLSSDHFCFNW